MSHGIHTQKKSWNCSNEHLDAFPEKPIRKRNNTQNEKKTLFKICMCFLRFSFNSLYWRTIYNFFAWQLLFLFGFVLFFFLSLFFRFFRVDWFDVGVSKSFLFGSILFKRTLQCANITIGLVICVHHQVQQRKREGEKKTKGKKNVQICFLFIISFTFYHTHCIAPPN